jgi:hypothetical protein
MPSPPDASVRQRKSSTCGPNQSAPSGPNQILIKYRLIEKPGIEVAAIVEVASANIGMDAGKENFNTFAPCTSYIGESKIGSVFIGSTKMHDAIHTIHPI